MATRSFKYRKYLSLLPLSACISEQFCGVCNQSSIATRHDRCIAIAVTILNSRISALYLTYIGILNYTLYIISNIGAACPTYIDCALNISARNITSKTVCKLLRFSDGKNASKCVAFKLFIKVYRLSALLLLDKICGMNC